MAPTAAPVSAWYFSAFRMLRVVETTFSAQRCHAAVLANFVTLCRLLPSSFIAPASRLGHGCDAKPG
jgi:hypothetical protein